MLRDFSVVRSDDCRDFIISHRPPPPLLKGNCETVAARVAQHNVGLVGLVGLALTACPLNTTLDWNLITDRV
jgi:hypothetical protein